jgi:K(+)-stimulated pyrophosphate-energized sodium pump
VGLAADVVVAAAIVAGAVVWSKRKPISMGDDAPTSTGDKPTERVSA